LETRAFDKRLAANGDVGLSARALCNFVALPFAANLSPHFHWAAPFRAIAGASIDGLSGRAWR
jgi:hypothetical protein